MKTAYLLHGTGGSNNDYFWFGSIKKVLENQGYQVWWPLLPNTESPDLISSRDYLEDNAPAFDEESIFIAHSSSCPLLISFMQFMKVPIKQVLLVAGFYSNLDDDGQSERMLEKSYDWDAIKKSANEIVLINSDNDPWGCNDIRARDVAIELGATLIVPTGQGHMGSLTFKQPYKKFPLLEKLLDI